MCNRHCSPRSPPPLFGERNVQHVQCCRPRVVEELRLDRLEAIQEATVPHRHQKIVLTFQIRIGQRLVLLDPREGFIRSGGAGFLC